MRRTSLRRPSWPRAGARVRHAPAAPHVLDALSRRIADNAPDAIRRRMDVAYAEPECSGYAPAPGGDRAWRLVVDETFVWCVVDAESQAALLEAVLGGPGATRPTTIERSIVAETMDRLLRGDNEPAHQPIESERERPLHGQWWRCNVDLTPRRGRSATLQLFTPPEPERTNPLEEQVADLRAVPLLVSVELGPVSIRLGDIVSWIPGAIVAMPRGSLEAAIAEVRPNVRLARGRIGSIADASGYAVRALEIAAIYRGSAA